MVQAKYLQKISGPLLDRFCLQIWLDSAEEGNSSDIFCQYLIKIAEQKKLDEFLQHFFKVQEQLSEQTDEDRVKDKSVKIVCDFSLRGRDKIERIAYTFEKLFPFLCGNKKFSEDVLTYRRLIGLFSRNY